MQANQSNVSTKLKKHDFVISEIEVTSQLIDLRSRQQYVEALKFDHDLAGGGNSKVQMSVMCRVVFHILIGFKSCGQQDEVDACGSYNSKALTWPDE